MTNSRIYLIRMTENQVVSAYESLKKDDKNGLAMHVLDQASQKQIKTMTDSEKDSLISYMLSVLKQVSELTDGDPERYELHINILDAIESCEDRGYRG